MISDRQVADRPRALGPSAVVGGRYRLEAFLAGGGMGEVYLARDELLDRRVVVKVPTGRVARDPRFRGPFEREARAAAALAHPNVVSVHDAGFDGDTPYLVMEFVAGRSLADVLAEEGPMAPTRAAAVGMSIAAGLAAAHQAGIVHRDVTPSNVMLTPAGGVKVLDFGIARWRDGTLEDATRPAHGTAEYLAPERIRDEPADERSDVYALGAVLYEMVTGRPPFVGDSTAAVLYGHLERLPDPPSVLNPAVPAALDAVVLRCLAKDPRARYRRASQLRADLERCVAADPSITRPLAGGPSTLPLPGQDRGRRWGRFKGWTGGRRVATAVAVAAILAVGGVVWFAPHGSLAARPSHRPPPPPPLVAPTSLRATGACDGFVKFRATVTWSPTASAAADGYVVLRALARGGPYRQVGVVPGHASTTFVDHGLGSATTYFYEVRATAGASQSPAARAVSTDTPLLCLS